MALAGPCENRGIKKPINALYFFAALDQHMKCTSCKQKYTFKVASLLK